jgi:hypothetical protein
LLLRRTNIRSAQAVSPAVDPAVRRGQHPALGRQWLREQLMHFTLNKAGCSLIQINAGGFSNQLSAAPSCV